MDDAWSSPAAKQLVDELPLVGNRCGECWESLSADIAKAQESEAEVQLARDLGVVYDLIRSSRRELEQRFGHSFWDDAQRAVEHHPRAMACLKMFRQIASIDRRDAVETLVDIGRKGIPYRLPSGRKKCFGRSDCGLSDYVDLTRVVQQLLSRDPRGVAAPSQAATATLGSTTRLVIRSKDGDAHVSLKSAGAGASPITLKGKRAGLLLILATPEYGKLIADYPTSADAFLWRQLWPNSCDYKAREGGPGSRLRTLVREVNRTLQQRLGMPMCGRWINRTGGTAYAIDSSIRCDLRGPSDRHRDCTVDPYDLDNARQVKPAHVRTAKRSVESEPSSEMLD